jgi:proline iminopeptidase
MSGGIICFATVLFIATFGMGNGHAEWVPEPEKAGYVAVEGGRIWYRMNGAGHFAEGKTPLIAIHGGPGFSHHYLLPLVDLADERTVILYDQLDSGHSDRPNRPENWRIERFTSEIDALRNELGLDRVMVFGNSWGGTVAAEYAISQPAGLVAVVLSSPLISTERWISDNTAYRRQLPEDVQKVLDQHEAAGTIDSKDYMDAVMVFYTRHLNRMDPWPAELNRSFEVFSPDLYTTMWGNTEFNATGTLKNYDALDRLQRIQVPVLYTCGEFDESTPAANKEFAKRTTNAEVKVIPDASHTAFLENRGLYMQTLRAFFSKVE